MGLPTNIVNGFLGYLFRNTPLALPSPEKVYVGLFNFNGEISGTGYERQEISFGAPSSGRVLNDTEVRFPVASSDWGEVTNAGIFDAPSGGIRLDDATIATVRFIRENDQFIIPIDGYRIEVK